jgi:hypothetical protein
MKSLKLICKVFRYNKYMSRGKQIKFHTKRAGRTNLPDTQMAPKRAELELIAHETGLSAGRTIEISCHRAGDEMILTLEYPNKDYKFKFNAAELLAYLKKFANKNQDIGSFEAFVRSDKGTVQFTLGPFNQLSITPPNFSQHPPCLPAYNTQQFLAQLV